MTPEQIALVQESFKSVAPIRDAAADIFYRRLFQLDPDLRPLFAGTNMAEQGNKLMTALAFVVNGLRRAETILPAVTALAQRHTGYGVRDEHYATVGKALIATLEEGLGTAFTADVRAGWIAAYDLLSGVMIAAARERPAAA